MRLRQRTIDQQNEHFLAFYSCKQEAINRNPYRRLSLYVNFKK